MSKIVAILLVQGLCAQKTRLISRLTQSSKAMRRAKKGKPCLSAANARLALQFSSLVKRFLILFKLHYNLAMYT